MSTLGERISASREAKNLSQAEFATLVGAKSAQVVSNWETGKNKPNADLLPIICNVLEVSASYLLDYHGKENGQLSAKARDIAARFDRLDPVSQRAVESLISIEETRQ